MYKIIIIIALLMVGFFVGQVYAIDAIYDYNSPSAVRGWHIHVADDDLSNAATLLTELDTTYAQLAASDTVEVVSAAADTTQTVTVYGINSNDQYRSEEIELNGTTAVEGSVTWKYIDHATVDIECAGAITVRRATGDTFIVSIPVGQLNTQVSQHFNGDKVSYISYFAAGLYTTTACVTFEIRWYPDAADCLDSGDGYEVLDRIYIDDAVTSPYNVSHAYAQPIRCPAGGWISVWATGDADNGDGYVVLQGFDVTK